MARIDASQLVDRLEIEDIVNSYALHIDLHQIDEWVDLFTQDAFFDEREFETGLHLGHEAIRAYGNLLKSTVKHAVHLMSNLVIRDLTGTSGTGVVFALVEAEMNSGERMRYMVRYEDDYVKTDAGWKFARRVLRKGLDPEAVG